LFLEIFFLWRHIVSFFSSNNIIMFNYIIK
jgi:hypothetical protein